MALDDDDQSSVLQFQSPGVSATGTASITSSVSMKKLGVGVNSLGEAVLHWSVRDPLSEIETCLILATFNGVTAPLGAVPSYSGYSTYEFVDRVLNTYVGRKTYKVVFIFYNGTIQVGDKSVSINKDTNIPLGYLK